MVAMPSTTYATSSLFFLQGKMDPLDQSLDDNHNILICPIDIGMVAPLQENDD
jgi:hypothetical protein